jgi:hypothetical protein
VLRIPAAPGDSAAITREIRLKVQVETFGNLDLLIVNVSEHLTKIAHVEPTRRCHRRRRRKQIMVRVPKRNQSGRAILICIFVA